MERSQQSKAASKQRLFEGDHVTCKKTVTIAGDPGRYVVQKGNIYIVLSVKRSCCCYVVDIGYHHYSGVVTTCCQCGSRKKQQSPVYISEHYFSRRRNKDKLQGKLDKMERENRRKAD